MGIWFWISMYLLLSIYVYFALRRWSKYKKFHLGETIIMILAPILMWFYFPLALKARNKNKQK